MGQVITMSNYKDTGDKSDESSSDVNASFSCENVEKALTPVKNSKSILINKGNKDKNEI